MWERKKEKKTGRLFDLSFKLPKVNRGHIHQRRGKNRRMLFIVLSIYCVRWSLYAASGDRVNAMLSRGRKERQRKVQTSTVNKKYSLCVSTGWVTSETQMYTVRVKVQWDTGKEKEREEERQKNRNETLAIEVRQESLIAGFNCGSFIHWMSVSLSLCMCFALFFLSHSHCLFFLCFISHLSSPCLFVFAWMTVSTWLRFTASSLNCIGSIITHCSCPFCRVTFPLALFSIKVMCVHLLNTTGREEETERVSERERETVWKLKRSSMCIITLSRRRRMTGRDEEIH